MTLSPPARNVLLAAAVVTCRTRLSMNLSMVLDVAVMSSTAARTIRLPSNNLAGARLPQQRARYSSKSNWFILSTTAACKPFLFMLLYPCHCIFNSVKVLTRNSAMFSPACKTGVYVKLTVSLGDNPIVKLIINARSVRFSSLHSPPSHPFHQPP